MGGDGGDLTPTPPSMAAFSIQELMRLIPGDALASIAEAHLKITVPLLERDDIGGIVPGDIVVSEDGIQEWTEDLNKLAMLAGFEHHIQRTLRSLGLGPEPVPRTKKDGNSAELICKQAIFYDARRTGWYPRYNRLRDAPKDALKRWLGQDTIDKAITRLKRRFAVFDHGKLKGAFQLRDCLGGRGAVL